MLNERIVDEGGYEACTVHVVGAYSVDVYDQEAMRVVCPWAVVMKAPAREIRFRRTGIRKRR
jgi:hypothetical protein